MVADPAHRVSALSALDAQRLCAIELKFFATANQTIDYV
jgi:hypothetical protein